MKKAKKPTPYIVEYYHQDGTRYEVHATKGAAMDRVHALRDREKDEGCANAKRATYDYITDCLIELFEREHGNCDQTTCSMSEALRHGYGVWSIYEYSLTGACSDTFYRLLGTICEKQLERNAEKELELFNAEVKSVDCIHCEARIFNYEGEDQTEFYCSSCNETFDTQDMRSIILRAARQFDPRQHETA